MAEFQLKIGTTLGSQESPCTKPVASRGWLSSPNPTDIFTYRSVESFLPGTKSGPQSLTHDPFKIDSWYHATENNAKVPSCRRHRSVNAASCRHPSSGLKVTQLSSVYPESFWAIKTHFVQWLMVYPVIPFNFLINLPESKVFCSYYWDQDTGPDPSTLILKAFLTKFIHVQCIPIYSCISVLPLLEESFSAP